MRKLALVSVWDKNGLEEFVRELVALGYEILSTGGTAKYLTDKGISITSVSSYTGSPEILDGRVKTLHPKIHGGILSRRGNSKDDDELKQAGIAPIDFVVVNLYPFTAKVAEIEAKGQSNHDPLVEFIDIGGPTMIRAAAKNCQYVVPLCDSADYGEVLSELRSSAGISLPTRQRLAAKVFATMSAYDGAIARYFSLQEQLLEGNGAPKTLAPVEALVLREREQLRYGENPHQRATLYERYQVGAPDSQLWRQIQGKELSYNNLLDMQGALDLFLELLPIAGKRHTAVIIKHSNPCGVAVRDTNVAAYQAARDCDPVSAFGGIIAVSGEFSKELVETILEGFVEVVLAERLTPEARSAFQAKKNVRVLECDFSKLQAVARRGWLSVRNSFGDYLVQTSDNTLADLDQAKLAAGPALSPQQRLDLKFAWAVCKHVKSNAIVVAKDEQAIGVGVGQMNRVDSARFSLQRARAFGFDPAGAVAASDAFLPFPDTLEVLSDAGVTALVQPGGSIKDEEVMKCATTRGVSMFFTGERHFRH